MTLISPLCATKTARIEKSKGLSESNNFGIQWNDMSIGNGQSWPLFEYTGSTDIVWGYYDKDGNEVEFNEQPGTGSLNVTPTETTTYYVKVTTNNTVCYAEKTIIVNPNPISNTISFSATQTKSLLYTFL